MTSDNQQWHELATDLVIAVMQSASTSKIRPRDWWDRALSAFYSAAAMSSAYGQMVSIMARKLQIDAYSIASSTRIVTVGNAVGEQFEDFRHICERDARYVVANAQVKRTLERESFDAAQSKLALQREVSRVTK